MTIATTDPSASGVDPHHVDADPDSIYHPDADQDPDPSFQIETQTLKKTAKLGSYSIHFGLSSAN